MQDSDQNEDDSKPIRHRQNILREQKIVDKILDILRLPFDKGYLAYELIEKPSFSDFLKMFSMCHRLIRQFLKNNVLSAYYVSPHIGFIQSQIGLKFNAEDTLIELFKDNYDLLLSIGAEQVKFLLGVIVRTGKKPRYIACLSTFCSASDKPFAKNQDLIVEQLLENLGNRENILLLPIVSRHWGTANFGIFQFYSQSNVSFLSFREKTEFSILGSKISNRALSKKLKWQAIFQNCGIRKS